MKLSCSIVVLFSFATVHLAGAEDAAAMWARKVQPLFDVQCVKCHGPIEQKGGLELDTPQAVLKGGDGGAVIVPGKPDDSPLFMNLAAGADPHMPPKKQLSDAERETVRTWIAAMTIAPVQKEVAARKFASVTAAIDTLIAEGWGIRGVKPATAADDRTWCRRLFLDLVGRIPTHAELAVFLTSTSADKRGALVDRLLASEEYPARMRELWDVFLMGRGKRGNQEERRIKNGWWSFLESSFRTNRPWNETVRALLAARAEKGASWFLYERKNDHQVIAEAVAPIVYGTQIDCAQCHDHPLAREIKQGHYWGLVAAFNRSKNVDGGNEVGESAIGGFVNFTNLKKESQPAVVTLLTGRSVSETRPSGDQKEADGDDQYVDPKAKARVPKFSRREAFADAATHDNPLLARAFVNRMWAALLGRGIVNPPDEMTARNVPSHPELLDWLSQDFASHKYEIRRLIRGIVMSRAYGLAASDAPLEAFAGAQERSLSAEQLARSWRVAAGLPPNDDALRRAVVTALPDVLPKEYNATFQQAQFLTNSPLFAELLKPAQKRIVGLADAPARVRETFLAAYGREPDAVESVETAAFLNARGNKLEEAVRDLLWALFTSAEFMTMPR